MADELAAARRLLPGVRLEPIERLRGNDRSVVHRVRATSADGQEPLADRQGVRRGR